MPIYNKREPAMPIPNYKNTKLYGLLMSQNISLSLLTKLPVNRYVSNRTGLGICLWYSSRPFLSQEWKISQLLVKFGNDKCPSDN